MTVLSGLDFEAFGRLRTRLLVQGVIRDASQTNLYRTLALSNPSAFGPVRPSEDPRALFRCHLSEQFQHALSLPPGLPFLVSHGIRHALSVLFEQVRAALFLPLDVYPAYAQIAQASGRLPCAYQARLGIPWDKLEASLGWTILVCDPLKPWGSRLSHADIHRLSSLARKKDGIVLVDAAYDSFPSQHWYEVICADAPVALLVSLAKGWLLPATAGGVLTTPVLSDQWRGAFMRAPKDAQKIRQGFEALAFLRDRPSQVASEVAIRQARLETFMDHLGLPVLASGGYFTVCPLTPERLLENGLLALPASVFGSPFAGSILSCLAFDD